MDRTQSKVDQLSEVFRFVKIEKENAGNPTEIKVCERFTLFTEERIRTAEQIVQSIKKKGLGFSKCRGHG